MQKFKLKRRLAAAFALLTVMMIFAVWRSDYLVRRSSNGRVYTMVDDVPSREVGLLLGCAKYVNGGRENLFFRHRIDCTVELYRNGKIQFIIVSGDNSRKDYDEPTDMRVALREEGIPDEVIYSDFAGFNTLDSVVRAKKVFGQSRLLVISQEFHVRRAIYIGQKNGIDLIGVCAKDVNGPNGIRTRFREYLARVKAVLDVSLFHRSPHFLGKPVLVGKRI